LLELLENYEESYEDNRTNYNQKTYYNYNLKNKLYEDLIKNRVRYEIFYSYDNEDYLIEEKIIINNNVSKSKIKKYNCFVYQSSQ
jgi:hypothetical protein